MANVLVTGTGREMALGFCFVRCYLAHGDHVIATVRKPSEALERLKAQYPDQLDILTMDVASTASVEAAAEEAAKRIPCLDVLINNAVVTSPDYPVHNSFEDCNLDYIAGVVLLKTLLKAPLTALFAGHDAANAVRYFVVVVFAVAVWPAAFRLFQSPGKNG